MFLGLPKGTLHLSEMGVHFPTSLLLDREDFYDRALVHRSLTIHLFHVTELRSRSGLLVVCHPGPLASSISPGGVIDP